jgi:hypothetical protein
VSGHLLGVLEPSVILQVNRDAGRPPGVTSDRGEKTRRLGPLPNRSPGVVPVQSAPRYLRSNRINVANRLSHLLTRAARVCIFKAICLPVQSAGGKKNHSSPLDHTLFGLRTSHPTQKRLFLLSRKADLRSAL